MSVAVCRGPVVPAFEAPCWLKPAEAGVDRRPTAQVDIWNAFQADVDKAAGAGAKKASSPKPYVHPLVRRSSSRLMSQKSLEVCTESLGNETGSGNFTASLDDMACLFNPPQPAAAAAEESFWENSAAYDREEEEYEGKELAAVNYHCSASTRSPRRRSFPPPLSSMSRRDGPCLQMRPRREDGRLVVEAVAVRPRGYLHAKRQGGRLCLSFVECSAREQSPESEITAPPTEAPYFPAVEPKNEQEAVEMEEEEEEEAEEEVEVVDRGTVIEVKVSTQLQAPTAAGKVHRSRLVINKFVGSTPLTVDQPRCHNDTTTHKEAAGDETPPPSKLRRVPSSTTTLAAAVAEASTGTNDESGGLHVSASANAEPKQLLLFTSRRGDKQDILQSVRRCRQLRQKPLFILEPYCIATT